jgi:hypothetical protein
VQQEYQFIKQAFSASDSVQSPKQGEEGAVSWFGSKHLHQQQAYFQIQG